MKEKRNKKESFLKTLVSKLDSKVKLILVNASIAAVDIFCFSKVGLGLSFSSPDALNKSLGITVLIMSIAAFGYLNWQILFGEGNAKSDIDELSTTQAGNIDEARDAKYYIGELRKLSTIIRFASSEISSAVEQYDEFKRKLIALKKVIDLNEDKNANLLWEAAADVEASLAENFRQILTKLVILDYDDEVRYTKKFRSFVIEKLGKNHETLALFDELLDEASRMKDKLNVEDISFVTTIEALKSIRGANNPSKGAFNHLLPNDKRYKLVVGSGGKREVVWVEEEANSSESSSIGKQSDGTNSEVQIPTMASVASKSQTATMATAAMNGGELPLLKVHELDSGDSQLQSTSSNFSGKGS